MTIMIFTKNKSQQLIKWVSFYVTSGQTTVLPVRYFYIPGISGYLSYEIFKFLEHNRDEETQNCFDVVIELQCLRFSSVCCPNLLPNTNPKNIHTLKGSISAWVDEKFAWVW